MASDVSAITQRFDHTFSEPPTKEELKTAKDAHLLLAALKVKGDRMTSLIECLLELATTGRYKLNGPDGKLKRENDAIDIASPSAVEKKRSNANTRRRRHGWHRLQGGYTMVDAILNIIRTGMGCWVMEQQGTDCSLNRL